jgi:hypothetical protein
MQTLTGNIAQEDYLGFWRPGEQPNYRAVMDFLQIDKEETARIARVAISSVRYDRKIPQELADRLEEIANIANRVAARPDAMERFENVWISTRLPFTDPALRSITSSTCRLQARLASEADQPARRSSLPRWLPRDQKA